MSKKHSKNNIINEFIIKYVNATHETQYTTINDEVFYKFFNSDVFYYYDTKNLFNLFKINKLSYEAMQYLLKNIVDTYLVYIDNQYTTYKTVFKSELAINDRIDNISIRNFNYIINKIVEWTISDKPFKIFIDEAKEDRKFNNNLLQFVVRSIGYSLYHKRYILYIIYKYAEAMNYETIIYLFDINIMWNYSDFDNYYKELINKRFDEELFKISDEDNYSDYLIVRYNEEEYTEYNYNIRSDHILSDYLELLQYNELMKNFDDIHTYLNYCENKHFVMSLNPYIVLFNYLVLSNRINDLKTMLLTIDIKCFHKDNLTYNYLCERIGIDSLNSSSNINNKKFITIEIYRLLIFLNINTDDMLKLINPYEAINILIYENYFNTEIDENDRYYKYNKYYDYTLFKREANNTRLKIIDKLKNKINYYLVH